jgi:uncharacterized protein
LEPLPLVAGRADMARLLTGRESVMRKKLIILAILLVVAAALFGLFGNFWTEYAWFEHLGFSAVFVRVLLAQIGIGVVFGLFAFFVLGIHIIFIRRNSKPREDWSIPTPEGDIDIKDIVKRFSTPVVIIGALIVAGALGFLASRHWEDVLKYLNRTDFGINEVILNKDVGFYLFVLPTLQMTHEWLVYLLGLCAVLSAMLYFSRGAIEMDGRLPKMSSAVRAHLLIALACVALVVGLGYYIEMFETLFSKRGVAYGATYTDVNANLIAYRIMIGASSVVALYLVIASRQKVSGPKAIKHPAYALAGLGALYLLTTFAWPTIVQQIVVKPNELDKERQYLEYAIAGTRSAYGLDKIEVREFPANSDLTANDLEKNQPTVENIKIWDHRPLRATYQQLQVIRLYYDFPEIDIDRYWVDGHYRQVMLSARELMHDQLPKQSQTWVNKHLQFTHGYGLCMSPVNESVREGLPNLWVKDIPPQTEHENLKITRPEIYYGRRTDDYVLVKTHEQEFDYPQGKGNKYTTYEGQGGVGVGGFFRRLLFAIRFGDKDLLFTKSLKEESRILFNRNIQNRIHTVAPFLMLDQEPYMVVADGRLVWIQDAYTISYRYPYSQPTALGRRKRINYIRNSVKIVVDAYHGKMDFFVFDEKDPLIATYRKIFPELFKDKKEMPKNLLPHVRYPRDLFTVQSAIYESFHMTDPRVFYNQEDKWTVSRELSEKASTRRQGASRRKVGVTANKVTDTARMAPYYMIMRLPGEPKEEFLLMVPYTPTNKDNMVAWMTARCDGDNYGKLLVYAFPKQKLIFGPMQIEARIDQDAEISKWITLRNQQGSTVIRGDLLVIPMEDAILYVEPVYLQSTQTKLPELRTVIVSFGQKLAMKTSLEESLFEVFGLSDKDKPKVDPAVPLGAQPDVTGSSLVQARRALGYYREGQKRLAKQDWAGYGEEQRKLKAALENLAKEIKAKLPQTLPAATE